MFIDTDLFINIASFIILISVMIAILGLMILVAMLIKQTFIKNKDLLFYDTEEPRTFDSEYSENNVKHLTDTPSSNVTYYNTLENDGVITNIEKEENENGDND